MGPKKRLKTGLAFLNLKANSTSKIIRFVNDIKQPKRVDSVPRLPSTSNTILLISLHKKQSSNNIYYSLVIFSLSTRNLLCRTAVEILSQDIANFACSHFRASSNSPFSVLTFLHALTSFPSSPEISIAQIFPLFIMYVPITPSHGLFLFQNVYNYNHMNNTFGPPCSINYFERQVFAF